MFETKPYLAVLKNFNFTKLWVSQLTSQLTNYLLGFAILIRVFTLTNSSVSVSLVIVAFGIATLIFGSVAGVYADSFDRRKLLTIINFSQAASVGLYFLVGNNFWGLVIITFLYSSLNQFYLPAEAPSIPSLVPPDQVLIANSYFSFTGSAALIIGFASAGPLIVEYGTHAPYLVGVILLIIAGFATFFLPPLRPNKISSSSLGLKKIWQKLKEGVLYFWQNKNLHFPLLSLIAVQIFNGMLITIAPAFMEQAIGINLAKGSLLVVAPLGVGILIGALTLGAESRYLSKQKLIFMGFVGMGLMVAFLSLINFVEHKFLFYSVFALFTGFFNAHIFAPSHSLLQLNSLEGVRGRVYGSLYVFLHVAATAPTFFIGVLADRIALTLVMMLLGLALIVSGVVIKLRFSSGNSVDF